MLVGKDLDMIAATGTRATLAAGQIGVFLVGSQTALGVNALTAGQRYTIAMKNSSGEIIETPVITYGNEKNKTAVEYVAPVSQTAAIGFNGTTGSIALANSSDYVFHLFWKDNSKTFGQGEPVKFAAYRSDASATQIEVANGLALNFNKNFSRENPKLFKAEILINSAGTAVPTGVDTIAFTNGSRYFTATDIDDATGTSAMAVGDYIRIGTATTSPCYKITAIDTTNNIGTIDMPFQGASISGLDTTYELVVAATAASAGAGVKISALDPRGDFEPGLVRFDNTSFDIEMNDVFGATTYTDLTASSIGSGSYYQVAQDEWFLRGNRGEAWRLGNYPKTITLEATSGKTYDYVSFNYAEPNSSTINGPVYAYGTVMIATEDASSGNIHASLKTCLGIS